MRKALMLFVILAAAFALPTADDTTAWFGTAGPSPLSDPRKPVMKYDDVFAPLPARSRIVPGKADELLDARGAESRSEDDRRLLARKPRRGRQGVGPPRGDAVVPAHDRMDRQRAQSGGAEGREGGNRSRCPARCGCRRRGSCSSIGDPAFGAGTQTVTLQSAFPQPGGASIPGGTLTAPVVYVGHGTDADLAGRDVKGKIAIVRVRPEPSLFGAGEQGVAARLVEKGAAGVINAIEGPGNAQYIDPRFACGKSPCFMIGGQDAWFLQTVIGKAANAGVLDRAEGRDVADVARAGRADAPRTASRRFRASRPRGSSSTRTRTATSRPATTTPAASRCCVGLAKYFAKQPKPKHTLMFVASGGHHGPGNGPASLVAAHPELKTGTLLILNLEHVAYADVVRGKVRAERTTSA